MEDFIQQQCAPQCGVKAPSEWQGHSPIYCICCRAGMCLCIKCRSMLIRGCQLHFNLQTANSWTPNYDGFNYQGLYNYIVDVFEKTPGPAAKKRSQALLNWWSMWAFRLITKNIRLHSDHDRKIFPTTSVHRQSNTTASQKAFEKQRAALERKEPAWTVLVFWWLFYTFVYTVPDSLLAIIHSISQRDFLNIVTMYDGPKLTIWLTLEKIS